MLFIWCLSQKKAFKTKYHARKNLQALRSLLCSDKMLISTISKKREFGLPNYLSLHPCHQKYYRKPKKLAFFCPDLGGYDDRRRFTRNYLPICCCPPISPHSQPIHQRKAEEVAALPRVGCCQIAQRGVQTRPVNWGGLMCPTRPWIISAA